MSFSIEDAIVIACEAHRGQLREGSNEPYIMHTLRVMMAVDSEAEKVVAVLHDVMEHTGDYYLSGVPSNVYVALHWLTRAKDENYFDYIRRVSSNSMSARVKCADIKDNMRDLHLLSNGESLGQRYSKALAILRSCTLE